MSYALDLVHLPPGVDREAEYQRMLQEKEKSFESSSRNNRLGPIDPSKEQAKLRLATALMKTHPTLKSFPHDYAGIAESEGISEAEARRRYRQVELNHRQHSFRILLFDDEAAAEFSSSSDSTGCANALRELWDCLQTLESIGGYSTHDPQVGRFLDLKSDFNVVLKQVCGAGVGEAFSKKT